MRPHKIIIVLMSAAFLSLALVGGVLLYANHQPKLGGNFSAVTAQGPWEFATDAKALNLLYVGYVKCPDVCPMALSFSRESFLKLSDDHLKKIRFIFLSVDTEHDTAQSVSAYANQFNSNFIGLTGSKQQIDFIMKLFGASYIVEPNEKSYLGYSIAHTDRIFFLDQSGFVIDSLPNPRSADIIIQKIKENL